MTKVTIQKILLIHHDHAILCRVAASCGSSFELVCAGSLSEGIDLLSREQIAVVLLELSLPDSSGVETLVRLQLAAPAIPVLTLNRDDEEWLALQAISRGAHDYIPTTHIDTYTLPRALRSAIEKRDVEDVLFAERDRAVVTLNSIGDAVLSTDIGGCITYLNAVAEGLTGWSREDAIGKPLAEVFEIVDGSTRLPARNPLDMAISQDRAVGLTLDCVLIRRDKVEFAIEDSAAPIHDRAGHVIGAVIVFHDVSVSRSISLQMEYSANHDLVTDLPNRLLLNDRISQAITLARRQARHFAVLFLDLDHFKYINDSLGHSIGDKLLQSISRRLVDCLRSSDTVSRQGGDEFVILLSEITEPEDASTSAEKILLRLAAPHIIGENQIHISGSIGISIFPQDGQDTEMLIQNADTAMYCAKESGRNTFRFFKAEMNEKAVERQSLECRLCRAVEREEFLLHYQPKVCLTSGRITGIEALIRWQDPDGDLVPPLRFVPIAEECGLIVPMGRWVLREACRQARAWQDAGLQQVPIAVNVSAVELREKHFLQTVRTTLSETGLDPNFLQLELTERVLMENSDSNAAVLKELKKMGIRLAVDDFGTGFSSLSYLRQFPIDVLKIDQSFIREMMVSPNDLAIVSAIISMANSLKHLVVAEGIETTEQKAHLRNLSCTEGQGFLFSQPLDALQFSDLLKAGIPLVN